MKNTPKKSKGLRFSTVFLYRNLLYGFAALWITFYHITAEFPSGKLFAPLRFLKTNGACGVDIFLLLTGYGLYKSMQRNSDLRVFYKKRFLRTFLPGFIVAAIFGGIANTGIGEYVVQLTYFGYWFGGFAYWYVAFILVVYLLFPLIYKVMNSKPNTLIYMIIAACIISLAVDRFTGLTEDYTRPISRIPVFLLGCYLAVLIEHGKDRIGKGMLIACVALSAAFLGFFYFQQRYMGNSMMQSSRGMAFMPMSILITLVLSYIFGAIQNFGIGRFICRCFAWCGEISLEIYLLFMRILQVLTANIECGTNSQVWKLNLTSFIFTMI